MDPKRDQPRRAPWLIGLFVVLGGVLLFSLYRAGTRRPMASHETTTTGAEMARDPDAPLIGAANAACTSHVSCKAAELCTRGRCEPISARTTECNDAMFRFARTSAELSTIAELTAERAARCTKAGHPPTITVEQSDDTFASAQTNTDLTNARMRNVQNALERRGLKGAPTRSASPSASP